MSEWEEHCETCGSTGCVYCGGPEVGYHTWCQPCQCSEGRRLADAQVLDQMLPKPNRQ